MITVRCTINHYDKELNTCTAILLNGDVICIDPFVFCAIPLSNEEYESGKGFDVVGKTFLLTSYTVYIDGVVPHEGGMIEIKAGA